MAKRVPPKEERSACSSHCLPGAQSWELEALQAKASFLWTRAHCPPVSLLSEHTQLPGPAASIFCHWHC